MKQYLRCSYAEERAENQLISSSPQHFTSQNSSTNTDTDGDGVYNDADLDDDNDGILDIVECGTSGTNAIVDDSFDGYTPTIYAQGGELPNWFNWNAGTPDINEQGGYETPCGVFRRL